MKDIYALIIKRKDEEAFGFPMDLSIIDYYTTTFSEEQLIDMLEKENIIPNLKDCNPVVAIGKKIRNKWAEDRKVPLITNSYILNFPFEQLPYLNIYPTICNVLYNQLQIFLKKDNISQTMKEAILSLKNNPQEFITLFKKLSYIEQRYFRIIIANNFELEKLFNQQPTTYQLIREKKDTILNEDKEEKKVI